jgi:hypothetical protein
MGAGKAQVFLPGRGGLTLPGRNMSRRESADGLKRLLAFIAAEWPGLRRASGIGMAEGPCYGKSSMQRKSLCEPFENKVRG